MTPLLNAELNLKTKREILNKLNKTQLVTIWRQVYPDQKLDPIVSNTRESLIDSLFRKLPYKSLKWGRTAKRSRRMKTLPSIPENEPINGSFTLPPIVPGEPDMRVKLVRVNPDGDCFYNVVIQSLKLKMTSRQLRNKLASKVKNKRVLRRIKAPLGSQLSWAEEEEIQALSNMYEVCFVIWDSSVNTWRVIYHDPQPNNKTYGLSNCKRVTYVYNHGTPFVSDTATRSTGYHFDLLEVIN